MDRTGREKRPENRTKRREAAGRCHPERFRDLSSNASWNGLWLAREFLEARERSGAFGLTARAGDRVADKRPGQRAKRSDGAKKAHEGAPRRKGSLGGFAALGGGVRESWRVSAEGEVLPWPLLGIP